MNDLNYTYDELTKSYVIAPKDDPKDRIEIEVGDTKQVDFYPQLKIMRWDNEVNLSVRLSDAELENKPPVTELDKIRLVADTKELEFYDVLPNEEHPEGAYKFEYILKEKPKSNKLTFSIQTKGLNFYYQPELTQKEIDEGVSRPDNVVGSYAVYHATEGGMNDIDGMEYKVGKFCHIYRPKITDAKGEWTWADLHIDVEQGLYEVTIPQEFLDKAVYPIKSNDTFGYTSEGGSNDNVGEDVIVGSVFTGAAGTGSSITIAQTNNVPQTADVKAGVYVHSDSSFLTNGGTETLTCQYFDTTKTFNFVTSPTFTATDYVLIAWATNSTAGSWFIKYDSGDTNQGHQDSQAFGSFPDPATFTHNDRKYSTYATYTASGGGEELTKELSDELSISEQISNKPTVVKAESLSIQEGVGNSVTLSLSDSVSVGDNISRAWQIIVQPDETLSVDDSVAKDSNRAITDELSVGELLSTKPSLTLADSLELNEGSIKHPAVMLEEVLNMEDGGTENVVSFILNEELTISDSVANILNLSASESLNIDSDLLASLAHNVSLNDILDMIESPETALMNYQINRNFRLDFG